MNTICNVIHEGVTGDINSAMLTLYSGARHGGAV